MEYKRISFTVVKQIIEEIFLCQRNKDWHLIPDPIHMLARDSGIKLQWTPIPRWTSFEYGDRVAHPQEFLDLLFKNDNEPVGESLLIVTDECFEERLGFIVRYEDLLEFA